jgi:hypothetical protein
VRERHRWEVQNDAVVDPSDLRSQAEDVVFTLEEVGPDELVLRVGDRGIGMTPDVIVDFFLKAGASFGPTRLDFDSLSPEEAIDWTKTGRFGVGAFAAFLLGSRIVVETRRPAADSGVRFVADLDEELVQLDLIDVPVGTEVSIPFAKKKLPLSGRYADADEDVDDPTMPFLNSIGAYYRLTQPDVQFFFRPRMENTKRSADVLRCRRRGEGFLMIGDLYPRRASMLSLGG